jgi:Flp pilus assembly protein TadD
MSGKMAEPEYDLDIIGVLEGTDKCSSFSLGWDYLRHYEDLFRQWRDAPINVMEIGVASGASLGVWRACFRSATIVGVDIDPTCARFAGDRVVVEIGSQVDPEFLRRVTAKYPPTVIIDDGSHLTDHIIFSFEHLFPTLQPNGLYVVEDLAFHFQADTANPTPAEGRSAPGYFLDLARSCLAKAVADPAADATSVYLTEQTDSVSFIHSAVAVQKKAARDVAKALRVAEEVLRRRPATAAQYGRLAQYILRHNGPLDRAEALARQAVEKSNHAPEAADVLCGILVKHNRLDDAARVLTEALQVHSDNGFLWTRLAQIEIALGRLAEAVAASRKAIVFRPNDTGPYDMLSRALELMGDIGEALSVAQRAAEIGRAKAGHADRLQRVEQLRAQHA